MQLGMVGLGRMGGNMAQRLLHGGHDLVVYDPNPEAVEAQQGAGAAGAASLGGSRRSSTPPGPCDRWCPRATPRRPQSPPSRTNWSPATPSSTAATPTTRIPSAGPGRWARRGHQLPRRRHERRRLRPRRGVQPDDRGRCPCRARLRRDNLLTGCPASTVRPDASAASPPGRHEVRLALSD